MADDDHTREMDISEWLPAQRTAADEPAFPDKTDRPRHGYDEPPTPDPVDPAWHVQEETMVLPVFVTGGVPEPAEAPLPVAEPAPVPEVDDYRLPSDERNMLIFVTALLALGTLAIVAMASIGR